MAGVKGIRETPVTPMRRRVPNREQISSNLLGRTSIVRASKHGVPDQEPGEAVSAALMCHPKTSELLLGRHHRVLSGFRSRSGMRTGRDVSDLAGRVSGGGSGRVFAYRPGGDATHPQSPVTTVSAELAAKTQGSEVAPGLKAQHFLAPGVSPKGSGPWVQPRTGHGASSSNQSALVQQGERGVTGDFAHSPQTTLSEPAVRLADSRFADGFPSMRHQIRRFSKFRRISPTSARGKRFFPAGRAGTP